MNLCKTFIMILFMGLSLCCLSACETIGSKFGGEWDKISHDDEHMRLTLLPGDRIVMKRYWGTNLFNRRMDIDPIWEEKEKNGKLAVRAGDKIHVFELNDTGKMFIKSYPGQSDIDVILGDNPPNSILVQEFVRKDSANDKPFANFEPVINMYGQTWKNAKAPNEELFNFDPKTGNIKLLDSRLLELSGGKSEMPLRHYEEFQVGSRITGSWFKYPNGLAVTFYPNADGIRGDVYIADFADHPIIARDLDKKLSAGQKDEFARFMERATIQTEWVKAEESRIEEERKVKEQSKQKEVEKRVQEEKRIQEEKAVAERKAAEKNRAMLSAFSFYGFSPSDSPQEVVERARKDFNIATTFPVEQKGNEIRRISLNTRKWGHIYVLPAQYMEDIFKRPIEANGMLEDFEGITMVHSYRIYYMNLLPSLFALNKGLSLDMISIEEKDGPDIGRLRIDFAYYTLPGEQPVMLHMRANGQIIKDAVEVFRERYGTPEKEFKKDGNDELVWRSLKELAFINEYYGRSELRYALLDIFSFDALNKYSQYVLDMAKMERQMEEDAKKKADEEKRNRESLHRSKI